jgi:hypothetical protein
MYNADMLEWKCEPLLSDIAKKSQYGSHDMLVILYVYWIKSLMILLEFMQIFSLEIITSMQIYRGWFVYVRADIFA